jgi:DNA-binding GntR family transcriptional regulator
MAEGAALSRESDRVADDLRHMIITLELKPGDIVSEAYLGELLECGRTPLREALQRLSQEYLIEIIPRRGIAITDLTVIDLVDLVEALVLMESFSARLAAERISDQDLQRLEAVVAEAEQMANEATFTSVAALDFRFHHVIAEATGNRFLADTIARWHRLGTRFAYVAWQRQGSAVPSLAEHREILAAFRNRDPDEAERLTREHTLNARERITSSFSKG